jgi:alpha,alpha-trehalase
LALSQNHTTVYAEYIKYYNNRRIYFNAIDKQGFYPDYADQHFYASSIIPLILFNKTTSYKFPEVVAPPASYEKTGQQWDFPNVWAPLVWFLHETSTYDQSLQVAQRWVDTVYCGWKKYDAMFEKYDAQRLGERGQGGEYVVQVGFGWTNGLTLELLIDHGDDLTASQQC